MVSFNDGSKKNLAIIGTLQKKMANYNKLSINEIKTYKNTKNKVTLSLSDQQNYRKLIGIFLDKK